MIVMEACIGHFFWGGDLRIGRWPSNERCPVFFGGEKLRGLILQTTNEEGNDLRGESTR